MSARRTAAARTWEFKARFRRHAFGWRSKPAIQRVRQAVGEIKRVARRDPVLAAEGAVLFLERVSPAIEQVDGSSGAIGTAVNHAVEDLVAIIAAAPTDAATRDAWLERLWKAHEADGISYIERLADFWGELCASKDLASEWASGATGGADATVLVAGRRPRVVDDGRRTKPRRPGGRAAGCQPAGRRFEAALWSQHVRRRKTLTRL